MSALDTYIEQTRRCADDGLYYPALAMALALPDICAALAGMKGKPGERYKKWLAEVGTLVAVEPEWIWRVRCAFLHDASSLLGERKDLGRIIVVEPPTGPVHRTHGSAGPGRFGSITIEVDELVGSLLEAASRWSRRNESLIRERALAGELFVVQPNAH